MGFISLAGQLMKQEVESQDKALSSKRSEAGRADSGEALTCISYIYSLEGKTSIALDSFESSTHIPFKPQTRETGGMFKAL